MVILALDTSSAAGSAAIVRDGALTIECEGDGSRAHGERLPRELMAILREANLTLSEIDAFAVVTGPGSFTGLRIGIATIQGLAVARHKLVTPVTTFEALAFVACRNSEHDPRSSTLDLRSSSLDPRSSSLIAVWIDAHRGEVFAALYAPGGTVVLEPPTSLSPEQTLDAWERAPRDARIQFTGDGAVRYAEVIRARFGDRADIPARAPALAGGAGRIAATGQGRAVAPHALVPLYVRRPDAELARERRQAAKP
jgi:tRNA threonylcarbamoyladenosine biosynthesis protein TsaB